MTLHDPEILELLRDEPELLALADAVAETQRPVRTRRARRIVPRAIAVAGVAAAILVAVLLAPGGSGNHAILGRALAAIGNGRVLHLVMRTGTGTVLVDLKSGRRTVETAEVESWTDRDFQRDHLVMRVRGQVADLLFPEDLKKEFRTFGPVDPAFAAFWTGYRRSLANGDAKLERKGVLAGRLVYWLRFPSFNRGQPGTEVAIDRRTYKPVLVRSHFSRIGRRDYRVLKAETIPFRRSDFKHVGASLLLGPGSASGGGSTSVAPGTGHGGLKAPWLTAGKRLAGLRLTSVQRYHVKSRGHRLDSVVLVYGTARHGLPQFGRRSVSIQQFIKPEQLFSRKNVPSGSVSIQQGEFTDDHGTHRSWTGYVVKHGIYVTIETGAGERAVVEAARALHPAS
jgi:hypothetical protein